MNGDLPTGNVALLIDADNASASAIDPVLTALADLGTVNIRRVYGNWSKPALKGWSEAALRYALEPQQQFDLTKGKNATDMKMTIDAMDLLASKRVTGFGIMSSDSDFMPLVTRIRQDGLTVYGFGRATTPEGFRAACNRFIDIDTLVRGAEAPPPPVAAPAPATASGKVDAEVVRILIDAYEASRRDPGGYASLGEVGQRAANRSSFDVRSYGFARLSDLFEAVPGFEVDRRDGGAFVRRRR
ncbi:NYN domain-containing protein [Sphingomonas sp. HF-S4]|uniref:NYN domain-containing protein n=1 Tax=Sphingomonas agrestis TaxID=3080540 RepID=A0ABU3Y4N1_9SPHN|nr:NYN domain-containing protein [Sphingomonas sp. HF-S4]MDV3456370.1 NYN domain-containing protein [Sphingomonas sp. HF-S4]